MNVEDRKKIKLTKNQILILKLLAKGMTEKAIAYEINKSINTVKYHKKEIFKKLNSSSSREAVIKALKYKLISMKEIDI